MLSLSGTDSPRGQGRPLQIDSHRRRARPLHPGGEEDQRPEQRQPDDGVRATEPAMDGASLHGRSRPAELERRSDRRSRSWSRSPGVRHGAALPQTWRRAAAELEPGGHGDQRISGGWGLRRASERTVVGLDASRGLGSPINGWMCRRVRKDGSCWALWAR